MPSYQNNTFDDIVYRNSTYYGTAAYLRSSVTNQANSWQPVSGENVISSLNDCVSTSKENTTVTYTLGWDNYFIVRAGDITASFTVLEGTDAGDEGEGARFHWFSVDNNLTLGPDYLISVGVTDPHPPEMLVSSFNFNHGINCYSSYGLHGTNITCKVYGLIDEIQMLPVRETSEIDSMQFLTTTQFYVHDDMAGKRTLAYNGITHTILDIENNTTNSFTFISQRGIGGVITFEKNHVTQKYSIDGRMDSFVAEIPIHGVKSISTSKEWITRTYYIQH